MDFMEAIKAMKEGKKVKRKAWAFIAELDGVSFKSKWEDGTEHKGFDLKDIEAIDWEIVPEEIKKTTLEYRGSLSDRIQYDDGRLKVEDVKEAINSFLDWITGVSLKRSEEHINSGEFNEKADKIFGKKLT